MDTMRGIRDALADARGNWRKIAADTGIDYFTISRIARGTTRHPRIDTVDGLRGWFAKNQPPKEQ